MNTDASANDTDVNRMTDEKWQAVLLNDASYDDQFIYAVKTTGIFCRPSCKSRPPNRENVRIFENAKQAQSAQFRPCKRCKPTGERLPDTEWVDQITRCMDTNYGETLTLDKLADMCHGSPYHLHRTFKRIKGVTPVEYIQHMRMTKAIEYLLHTDNAIAEIATLVGIPSTPYFITLFKKITGHTPTDYRRVNSNHTHSIKEVNDRGNKH